MRPSAYSILINTTRNIYWFIADWYVWTVIWHRNYSFLYEYNYLINDGDDNDLVFKWGFQQLQLECPLVNVIWWSQADLSNGIFLYVVNQNDFVLLSLSLSLLLYISRSLPPSSFNPPLSHIVCTTLPPSHPHSHQFLSIKHKKTIPNKKMSMKIDDSIPCLWCICFEKQMICILVCFHCRHDTGHSYDSAFFLKKLFVPCHYSWSL